MADSVFTKMLKGEVPREIIYQDDMCFVIPTIAPHNPGHCLVITNKQINYWEDLDDVTYVHIMRVAKGIAKAIKAVYGCPRVGISTVGFEVPHVHIHLIPLYKMKDANHSQASLTDLESVRPEANKIKAELKARGGVGV